MEEEEKKKGNTLKIHKRETEELQKSRNETRTNKQKLWSARYFQTWCAEKDLAFDFKSISKLELNQSPHRFYATVKNGKGEHCFQQLCHVC